MTEPQLPAGIIPTERLLTAPEYHRLANVPPEIEWFANMRNRNTRRAYEKAIGDFMRFTGIDRPEEFRTVTRAHVIAWRDDLASRTLMTAPRSGTAWRRCPRCSSISARKTPSPTTRSRASSGPASRAAKARPRRSATTRPASCSTLPIRIPPPRKSSRRDRAILSTLLFHALRRDELCKLKVKDARHARRGVPHLKVAGKGDKTRYLPLHPGTNELIHDYLDAAGHGEDENGALFRPLKNNRTGTLNARSRPTRSISWFAAIRPISASRSARTRYAQRPPPMRSTIRPISPRSRSGSATAISPPPASMIIARPGRRTARPSRSTMSSQALR